MILSGFFLFLCFFLVNLSNHAVQVCALKIKNAKSPKQVGSAISSGFLRSVMHDRDLAEMFPGLHGDPEQTIDACMKKHAETLYMAARRLAKDHTVHTEYRTRSLIKSVGTIGNALADVLENCDKLAKQRTDAQEKHGAALRKPDNGVSAIDRLKRAVSLLHNPPHFTFDANRHKESKDVGLLGNEHSEHGRWAGVDIEGYDITRHIKQMADACGNGVWTDVGYHAGRIARLLGWGELGLGERRDNAHHHMTMLRGQIQRINVGANMAKKLAPGVAAEMRQYQKQTVGQQRQDAIDLQNKRAAESAAIRAKQHSAHQPVGLTDLMISGGGMGAFHVTPHASTAELRAFDRDLAVPLASMLHSNTKEELAAATRITYHGDGAPGQKSG